MTKRVRITEKRSVALRLKSCQIIINWQWKKVENNSEARGYINDGLLEEAKGCIPPA